MKIFPCSRNSTFSSELLPSEWLGMARQRCWSHRYRWRRTVAMRRTLVEMLRWNKGIRGWRDGSTSTCSGERKRNRPEQWKICKGQIGDRMIIVNSSRCDEVWTDLASSPEVFELLQWLFISITSLKEIRLDLVRRRMVSHWRGHHRMECVRQSTIDSLRVDWFECWIDGHQSEVRAHRPAVDRRRKVQDHLSRDLIQTDRRERERRCNGLTHSMVKDEVVESFVSTVLDEWTGAKAVPSRSDLSRSALNPLDAKVVEEIFSAAVEWTDGWTSQAAALNVRFSLHSSFDVKRRSKKYSFSFASPCFFQVESHWEWFQLKWSSRNAFVSDWSVFLLLKDIDSPISWKKENKRYPRLRSAGWGKQISRWLRRAFLLFHVDLVRREAHSSTENYSTLADLCKEIFLDLSWHISDPIDVRWLVFERMPKASPRTSVLQGIDQKRWKRRFVLVSRCKSLISLSLGSVGNLLNVIPLVSIWTSFVRIPLLLICLNSKNTDRANRSTFLFVCLGAYDQRWRRASDNFSQRTLSIQSLAKKSIVISISIYSLHPPCSLWIRSGDPTTDRWDFRSSLCTLLSVSVTNSSQALLLARQAPLPTEVEASSTTHCDFNTLSGRDTLRQTNWSVRTPRSFSSFAPGRSLLKIDIGATRTDHCTHLNTPFLSSFQRFVSLLRRSIVVLLFSMF